MDKNGGKFIVHFFHVIVVLQFLKHAGNTDVWIEVWAAWSWFHLGEYRRALDLYMEIGAREAVDSRVQDTLALDTAVCYFYLGLRLE